MDGQDYFSSHLFRFSSLDVSPKVYSSKICGSLPRALLDPTTWIEISLHDFMKILVFSSKNLPNFLLPNLLILFHLSPLMMDDFTSFRTLASP
jgi:hypothetical protein